MNRRSCGSTVSDADAPSEPKTSAWNEAATPPSTTHPMKTATCASSASFRTATTAWPEQTARASVSAVAGYRRRGSCPSARARRDREPRASVGLVVRACVARAVRLVVRVLVALSVIARFLIALSALSGRLDLSGRLALSALALSGLALSGELERCGERDSALESLVEPLVVAHRRRVRRGNQPRAHRRRNEALDVDERVGARGRVVVDVADRPEQPIHGCHVATLARAHFFVFRFCTPCALPFNRAGIPARKTPKNK